MRRVSIYIVTVLIMVFAFTSVAWAGPAINRDLQQMSQSGDDNPQAKIDSHKGGGHPGGGVKHHPGGGVKHHPGGGVKHHPGGGVKHHPGGGVKHHPGGGVKHHPGDGIKHHPGDGIKHKGGHDVIKHHGGHHFDKHRHHHWGRDWHRHHQHWGHHFHDWDWFVGFGIVALGAYYLADNAEESIYIHFETEDKTYFDQLTLRYGNYIFRERIAGFGGLGWRYYWIDDTNVVCVFVRDDGYTHTFIWSRADAGSQAIALGLLNAAQLAMYDGYAADMPAALAAEYIRIVMWSQTEWK